MTTTLDLKTLQTASSRSTDNETFLHLEQVTHRYGNRAPVLENYNLAIKEGECICILGPSGCGKTTTLNIIAGFITPTSGSLMVQGDDMTNRPTHKRGFGMVFQGHALFPHMTIYDNVAFGLKQRKESKATIRAAVNESLAAVSLGHAGTKYPHELSGGEAQRIGLARALAVRPRILLLDEPLSNLDAKLRRQMQHEIRRIHDEYGLTSVYVTHDQEEALILGDRVVVMNNGKIEQIAAPRELYEEPATEFVARFVGERNFITGRCLQVSDTSMEIETENGPTLYVLPRAGIEPGDPVLLAVLEERLRLSEQPLGTLNEMPVKITDNLYRGGKSLVHLASESIPFSAQIPSEQARAFPTGTSAWLQLDPTILVPIPVEGH